MSELDKIKQVLKRNKSVLKRQFKVKALGIFGSYVRGKQKKNSDVDILVEFNQTPGLFDYVRTENRLSGILKKRVDLVMKGSLKPAIGKYIMREVVYV
ncbi:MAG: nucleotidyltransferase family protein [Candidatus Omnitrophica bacterium]|nr:nucleotidyltransferase family protein [Candidatus Omnitrophota bacterium]